MDSSSKPETSTESSSTISNKPSDNDQQKDLQSKQASTKTSISSHSSLGVGSSAGIGIPATTTTADTAKAISVTTSATTATTSSSSSTPHSVTISLGVGVLQVGKPQPRIPSPPKLSGLISSSSQDVTTNSVTSTLASTGGNKEGGKTVASTSSVSVFTPITTSSFENPTSKAVTETAKSSVSASSQNQPLISNPLATPPVVSETSSTGGVLTAVSSTLSAMKRPPSEISGSSNSGTASTETGEPEASTEHKRKKMRKENRSDRSDSPGSSSSTASMAGLGRGVRNSGSKQGSPSSSVGGSGVGEFSGKTSVFAGKSNDGPSSAQEKSEESSKSRSHESSVSSSSIGSGNNASNTSGNPYGSSSSNGGGGPKVPPLKIVLQSHSHSTVTTASSTGGTSSVSVTFKNSSGGEDSTQNTSFGSGTGFPYVVSSTTTDSNNSGSNAPETVPMSVPNPLSSKSGSQSSKNTEPNETQNETSKDSPQPPKTFGLSASTAKTSSTASDISSSTAATTSHSTTTASSTSSSTSITISTASGSSDKFKDTTSISDTNESSTDVTHEKLKSEDDSKKDAGSSQHGNSTSSSTPSATSNSSQSSATASNDPDKEKELAKEKDGSGKDTGATPKEKEKPVRVTRSSQRILKEGVGSHTPNSPSSSSPKTSACPSPSHTHQTDSQGSMEGAAAGSSNAKQAPQDGTEKMDTSEPVELHPRKRKIKNKEVPAAASACTASSSSSSNAAPEDPGEKQQASANAANEQPMLNCFEMYLNIRKQIDRRRRNLFHVTPKPPKGFKDYLMNRATYVLAGNANALAVPLLNPPQSQPTPMKEFFSEQEKERHKLRLQHLVEKEKLVLSVEQEILRVHGRAARALSNQTLPFSVCTILKDQEVYNLLTPEQEEKDINARSRYNGRLFLSWLQDVDDKWDKIKEFMLLRHHNEAESLHAVQKMDWEWKLKEHGLCELKANPIIDDLSVPMVHVSDDFDLLPA